MFLTTIHDPFVVNRQEYWTIAWLMFNICLYYTSKQLFTPPHEKDEDDEY